MHCMRRYDNVIKQVTWLDEIRFVHFPQVIMENVEREEVIWRLPVLVPR